MLRDFGQAANAVPDTAARKPPAASVDGLLDEVRGANLSAGDLLARYVSLVYSRTGSYEAAALLA